MISFVYEVQIFADMKFIDDLLYTVDLSKHITSN